MQLSREELLKQLDKDLELFARKNSPSEVQSDPQFSISDLKANLKDSPDAKQYFVEAYEHLLQNSPTADATKYINNFSRLAVNYNGPLSPAVLTAFINNLIIATQLVFNKEHPYVPRKLEATVPEEPTKETTAPKDPFAAIVAEELNKNIKDTLPPIEIDTPQKIQETADEALKRINPPENIQIDDLASFLSKTEPLKQESLEDQARRHLKILASNPSEDSKDDIIKELGASKDLISYLKEAYSHIKVNNNKNLQDEKEQQIAFFTKDDGHLRTVDKTQAIRNYISIAQREYNPLDDLKVATDKSFQLDTSPVDTKLKPRSVGVVLGQFESKETNKTSTIADSDNQLSEADNDHVPSQIELDVLPIDLNQDSVNSVDEQIANLTQQLEQELKEETKPNNDKATADLMKFANKTLKESRVEYLNDLFIEDINSDITADLIRAQTPKPEPDMISTEPEELAPILGKHERDDSSSEDEEESGNKRQKQGDTDDKANLDSMPLVVAEIDSTPDEDIALGEIVEESYENNEVIPGAEIITDAAEDPSAKESKKPDDLPVAEVVEEQPEDVVDGIPVAEIADEISKIKPDSSLDDQDDDVPYGIPVDPITGEDDQGVGDKRGRDEDEMDQDVPFKRQKIVGDESEELNNTEDVSDLDSEANVAQVGIEDVSDLDSEDGAAQVGIEDVSDLDSEDGAAQVDIEDDSDLDSEDGAAQVDIENVSGLDSEDGAAQVGIEDVSDLDSEDGAAQVDIEDDSDLDSEDGAAQLSIEDESASDDSEIDFAEVDVDDDFVSPGEGKPDKPATTGEGEPDKPATTGEGEPDKPATTGEGDDDDDQIIPTYPNPQDGSGLTTPERIITYDVEPPEGATTDIEAHTLMYRLAKQAAKETPISRFATLSHHARAPSNAAVVAEFDLKITEQEVQKLFTEKFENLTNKFDTRTPGKGQSKYETDFQDFNNAEKQIIYTDRFNKHGDTITNKDNQKLLSTEYKKSPGSENVQSLRITDHQVADSKLATQALLVDHLQIAGKALKAVAVTIKSVDASGNIDPEGAIQGAFNALHAGLVPKFDKNTWEQVNAFIAKSKTEEIFIDPDDVYKQGYLSPAFLEFISKLDPENTKMMKTDPLAVAKDFTEVMKKINTHETFTDIRSDNITATEAIRSPRPHR